MTSTLKLAISVFACLMLLWPGAAVAEAPTPKGGTWKGKTSQGLPVKFKVERKGKRWEVVSATFKARAKCESDLTGTVTTYSPDPSTHSFPVLDDDGPDEGNDYGQSKDWWAWSHFGGGSADAQDIEDGALVEEASSFIAMYGKFTSESKAKGWVKRRIEQTLVDGRYSKCWIPRVTWEAHS
jgi:hypothetical protein